MLQSRPSYPEFLCATGLQSPWPYDLPRFNLLRMRFSFLPSLSCIFGFFCTSESGVLRRRNAAKQIRGEDSDVIQHEDMMP
jgi:hypothetical protein